MLSKWAEVAYLAYPVSSESEMQLLANRERKMTGILSQHQKNANFKDRQTNNAIKVFATFAGF